jgi:hypothetical protein
MSDPPAKKKTITGIESCDFARVKNLQKMSPRKKNCGKYLYRRRKQ